MKKIAFVLLLVASSTWAVDHFILHGVRRLAQDVYRSSGGTWVYTAACQHYAWDEEVVVTKRSPLAMHVTWEDGSTCLVRTIR